MTSLARLGILGLALLAPRAVLAQADPAERERVVDTVEFDASAPPEPPPPPEPPRAREPRVPFGAPGQWALFSSSTSLGLSSRAYSNSDAQSANVGGELGFDAFVARNFSIGPDVTGGYTVTQGYSSSALERTTSESISIGARAGVNVPISPIFSWFPRLTVGVEWTHSQLETITPYLGNLGSGATTQSSVGPWLNLYAPLLFEVAPHFLIGVGPRVVHHFDQQRGGPNDGSQTTTYGGQFVFGGFWGGAEPVIDASDDAQAAERAPKPRFGRHGQLVFTFDAGGSALATSDSKSSTSSTTVSFDPGFDYFTTNGLSVGADLSFSHDSGNTYDSLGARTDFDNTSFGFGPRLGYNLELGERVSVWPRLAFDYGRSSQNSSSSLGTNDHSRALNWFSISVPALWHVTSHFFVGGGPYVTHEISDKDERGFENLATRFGASAELGGYFDAG